MLLTTDKYVRNYCIRKREMITSPTTHPMSEFVLPRNSNLHYFEKDDGQVGMVATNPLLANTDKAKFISGFVNAYIEPRSPTFKVVAVNKMELILDYHRKNPKMLNAKFAKSDAALIHNVVVTNYGIMDSNIKYVGGMRIWWRSYQNFYGSVFKNIENLSSVNKRDNFLVLELPDIFPTLAMLKQFAKEESPQTLNKIATPERMHVAQLWLWLMDSPRSLLPTKGADKVYIVWKYKDEWMSINLGSIKQYIRKYNHRATWDVERAQKNVLAMLMAIKYGVIADEAIDLVGGDEDEHISPVEMQARTLNLGNDKKRNVASAINDFVEANKGLLPDEDDEALEDLALNDDDARSARIDLFLNSMDEQFGAAMSLIGVSSSPEMIELETKPVIESNEEVGQTEVNVDITYKAYNAPPDDLDSMFDRALKEHIVTGSLTPQQVKRFEKLSQRRKEIPNPKGGEGTLESASVIKPEDLVVNKDVKFVDKIKGVNDDSMLKSTLIEFDKKYINDVMDKDIYNSVQWLQRAGFCVTDYKTKEVVKLGTQYVEHSVKIVPLRGKESTIKFDIPVFNDDGVMESRGVKSRLIKQRVDVGIRKVDFDTVAMTSYMSKIFIGRSGFVAYSKELWLKAQLVALTDRVGEIKVTFGNVFDREVELPISYSMYARSVKSIKTPEYEFNFDFSKQKSFFGDEVATEFAKTLPNQVLVGKGKDTLLIMTKDGIIHKCDINNADHVAIGTLEEVLGMPFEKAPLDCADARIVTKEIPLGFILSYYLGFGNLLETLGVKYRIIPKNTRGTTYTPNMPVVQFSDCTVAVDVCDYKASIIIESLNRYKRAIKNFDMFEFDKRSIYTIVAGQVGVAPRYIRELDILRSLWVGPIDREEFLAQGEPTDFVLLLLRAAELLESDQHPEEMDRAYQRDRGYERISGMVYANLVSAVRTHNSNPVQANATLSMKPSAVWKTMIEDDTFTGIEESNPIHALKEQERVLYRGAGGRSARTMNSKSRMFSKNSIGVDSEASVDNGDAGTIRFLAANPNYTSLRGRSGTLDRFDQEVNSSCLATSHLLAAAIDRDDPKRRTFASIQNSRTTNSEQSTLLPVITGYEFAIGHRTPDLYATIAKKEGKVVEVTDHAVTVKYKDGTTQSVQLGKRDGKWSGKTIPHVVKTDLRVGAKVDIGTAIAFNPLFFKMDTLSGNLAYKQGILGRIGLVENEYTYEDSCELYKGITDMLVTKNTEERFISVDFDRDVHDLVKVGDEVVYDTILCVLADQIGGVAAEFGEKSLSALKEVTSRSPRAEYKGVISKVECVYVGEFDDMSETLQTIAGASDRRMFKIARDLGKPKVSGQLTTSDRYSGQMLDRNKAIIKVSIDISQSMGIGSKVVFGHQMKSVCSVTHDVEVTTMDGVPYHGLFSYTSNIKRVVESLLLVGVVSTYAVNTAIAVCDIYDKD